MGAGSNPDTFIDSKFMKRRQCAYWKYANIVPMYLAEKKVKPENYSPVPLSNGLTKTFETIIKDKWVKYLNELRVFTEHQFGFKGGRSGITNLLSFCSRTKYVLQVSCLWVNCICLDLRKAFDKVPHECLLLKL